ncbi:50S ribosomal protein L28 [bacterium]|jgi:large subunit ribosomal protein L28|nr:50S ribosomal protein L28 [bacterium]
MSKFCEICGKGPKAGKTITRRGLAKKKGGVGRKITGISKRVFTPNLQNVKALINGGTKTVSVCAKCLKAGKIKKA